MDIRNYVTEEKARHELVKDLSALLNDLQFAEKQVLLLSSGGSSIHMFNELDERLGGEYLTLSVLDERYDSQNKDSNFADLKKTSFFQAARKKGTKTIDTSVRNGFTIDEVAHQFESDLRQWVAENPEGKIVSTIGLGIDGNVSGIKRFRSEKAFEILFQQDPWVVPYKTLTKDEVPHRITTSFTFLRKINIFFGHIMGDGKKEALQKCFSEGPYFEHPGRILKELTGTIYTDIQDIRK